MGLQPFLIPLIILAASFIAAKTINLILEILIKKTEKTDTKIDDIILHALGRPLYILIIAAGLYYAVLQSPYLADLIDKTLLDIADKSPLVLKSPKPLVRFTEYASSQNFEFLVWVKHYNDRHLAVDQILREIFTRFREEGIAIPFKQMDIHFKKDSSKTP
jgi:small-conductance mechanosensitive channel